MRSSLFVLVLASLPLAAACSAFTGVDSDGLVPVSDDAGGSSSDGGRHDSGTRDSGSRDSGSTSHLDGGSIENMGPECTSLQSCCDFLDTTTAATCRSTALADDETSCEDDLFTYQEDGFCNGSITPPPFDSGAPPPPPVDSGILAGGYCSELLGCCGSDASCLSVAVAADETSCELQLFTEIQGGSTACVFP